MAATRTWTVEIFLTEERDMTTHAHAVLRTDTATVFEGAGSAPSNPSDVLVPLAGDELATEQALLDLAQHVRVAREGRRSLLTGPQR